jgi:hypothetical protein
MSAAENIWCTVRHGRYLHAVYKRITIHPKVIQNLRIIPNCEKCYEGKMLLKSLQQRVPKKMIFEL